MYIAQLSLRTSNALKALVSRRTGTF